MSNNKLVDFDKLVLPEGKNKLEILTGVDFSGTEIKDITLTIKTGEEFINKYNFIQQQKLICIEALHPDYKDFDDTKKKLTFSKYF